MEGLVFSMRGGGGCSPQKGYKGVLKISRSSDEVPFPGRPKNKEFHIARLYGCIPSLRGPILSRILWGGRGFGDSRDYQS